MKVSKEPSPSPGYGTTRVLKSFVGEAVRSNGLMYFRTLFWLTCASGSTGASGKKTQLLVGANEWH
jgi:hypothetical protein